jgi:hypothetical protein
MGMRKMWAPLCMGLALGFSRIDVARAAGDAGALAVSGGAKLVHAPSANAHAPVANAHAPGPNATPVPSASAGPNVGMRASSVKPRRRAGATPAKAV